MKGWVVAIVIGILLLSWAMLLSHAPVFEKDRTNTYDAAQTISDPQQPLAIFGEIDRLHELDHYTFIAKDDIELRVQLLVPKKKELEDFHPSLVLIGPGFSGNSTIIGELPPTTGAIDLVAGDEDYKKLMTDKFTFTKYWKGPTETIRISEEGQYYIVVIPNDDEMGNYVLRIGEQKDIEFTKVFGAFFSWFRIQWMYWS